jgi:hypothetical protein
MEDVHNCLLMFNSGMQNGDQILTQVFFGLSHYFPFALGFSNCYAICFGVRLIGLPSTDCKVNQYIKCYI